METIYFDKVPSDIKQIISVCFPNYTGHKVKYCDIIPESFDSYWSGGSKDTFAFYHLDTKKLYIMPSNHPIFDKSPNTIKCLPPRVIIVQHSIFCGRDAGITIYSNAADITPFLPAPQIELTREQKIVLIATRSLKSSYNGIANYRFSEAKRETGITLEQYNNAKTQLIADGYLNKAGAITPKGKNSIGFDSLYMFKKQIA